MTKVRSFDEKIKVISQISAPITKKGVQSFLGLARFYRRYILDFSKRTHKLSQLTKKNSEFVWTDRHYSKFEEIKSKLCKAPILTYLDWDKTFVIQTDASIVGLGVMLMQKHDQGYKVIEYASRSTTPCETRYSISKLECVAVI